VRLGFACAWWRPVETTWSHIPASLMDGLSSRPDVDIVRIDAQRNPLTAAALIATAKLRSYGIWKHQPLNRQLTERRVRRAVKAGRLDAVLAVADAEPILDVPTFLYQDGNFSVARAYRDVLAEYAPSLCRYPDGALDDLVAAQRAAYLAADEVFAFGQWFADWLIEQDGVPADRVHVIGGGLNADPAVRPIAERGAGGTRVLFVGREFHRKGGDLVVSAVQRLRASGSGDFTLTVVGPQAWPLPTPPPPWVDFRAELRPGELASMWAEHDIFAMPSWYEPYGLVFLEARAAGLPCLARQDFCMPEIVPDHAGRLISARGGADEVADQLLAISKDANLFERVAADAASVRAEHSWSRVAERAMGHITSVVGPA